MFQNVLNSHAPLKNIEVKLRREHKKWLSKELRSVINEKHLCSLNGKKIIIKSSLTVTKY